MSLFDNNNQNQNTTVTEPVQEPVMDQGLLEDMVKAGILYGRKKSKTHPHMKPFIHTTRNGIEILELSKTMEAIEKAGEFLKGIAKKDGLLIAVGTKPASQSLIEEFAKKFAYPFVTKRWLGGTLTNFKTISKRLQYYMNLKSDQATGKLEKYTKKERVAFGKQIEKLNGFFGGLEKMNRLPDALITINANDHKTAVLEARRMKIPVVAVLSTDTDPELVDYAIPANDNSKTSIDWILNKLASKIEEGAKEKIVIAKPTEKATG